mmetsp:Transcript_15548/g.22525  ORF Transcript_15548/g.22525 Transcript_15548/m.22525 type:complete len:148 (+) Transcript_15548:73-516(+)
MTRVSEAKEMNYGKVESRLTQKLMQGYELLSNTFCPTCSSPLVQIGDANKLNSSGIPFSTLCDEIPKLIPSRSFEHEVVYGVPFCVCCCAHIVPNNNKAGKSVVKQLQKAQEKRPEGDSVTASSSDLSGDDSLNDDSVATMKHFTVR